MMKYIRKTFILLVFLSLFGMVALDVVWGEDSSYVSNFVQSSTHTGGYGTDGTDGKDGADGRDGAPGKDGADVYSTENRATIKLYNTTYDDKHATYIYSTTTGTGKVEKSFNASSESASNNLNATSVSEVTLTQTATSAQQSRVQSIISALQKLIEQYVNFLF